jgi:hypothetical protein
MYKLATTYQPLLPRVAALLSIICAVCALLYGIFLLETVAHAASRDTAQNQMQALSEQVSAMEAQYLSATQALTPDRAAALGFVAPANVVTVFMQPSEVLTLANPRVQ